MKETINEMKMQPIEWEKIFENYISDKGLIYKVQKNSNCPSLELLYLWRLICDGFGLRLDNRDFLGEPVAKT